MLINYKISHCHLSIFKMQMDGHHKTKLEKIQKKNFFFFFFQNSSGRAAGISGTVVNTA